MLTQCAYKVYTEDALIDQLLDRLGSGCLYLRLDLTKGFNKGILSDPLDSPIP